MTVVQPTVLKEAICQKSEKLLLINIASLSLGLEISGGVMSVVIKGNTPIPRLKMEMFNTPNWSDDPSLRR
jgi:L1 cell adhesion molecule like protein